MLYDLITSIKKNLIT